MAANDRKRAMHNGQYWVFKLKAYKQKTSNEKNKHNQQEKLKDQSLIGYRLSKTFKDQDWIQH